MAKQHVEVPCSGIRVQGVHFNHTVIQVTANLPGQMCRNMPQIVSYQIGSAELVLTTTRLP